MEDEVRAPASRRSMWVAIAATCVAVPLLLFDNVSTGSDQPASTVPTLRTATVVMPLDRPATGPVKGISVVTSSTTSSTVPITANTTTTTTRS